MANKKLSEQTEITSADSTDIIHVVVDPGGTPTSYKIQKDNFLKDCVSQDESPSLSADLDAQGNYAVDLQNFSDMLAGDGPGYWFDGTNDAITISDDSNLDFDTDDDFYIQILIKPSDITRTTDYLINKEAGGIGWGLYINQDDLYIRIDDGTNDATAIIGTAVFVNNTWALITVIFDRSGNATAYINGNLVGTVDISSVVNTIANAGDFHIGNDSAGGNEFKGEIQLCNVGNLAITEQAIINGAPIPYKYIGASQIEQLSNYDFSGTWAGNLPDGWLQVGTVDANSYLTADDANDRLGIYTDNTDLIGVYQNGLTVGKQYRYTISIHSITGSLSIFTDSIIESFTSSGIYTGTFTATTTVFQLIRTTGLNLDCYINYASIIQIGCVLNLNPSGIGTSTWRDDSGNNLDGTVSGALPVNKTPINDFESTGIDDNATETAITINSSENVGIGTESPGKDLEISSSEATIRLRDSDAANTYSDIKQSGANLIFSSDPNNLVGSSLMRFYTDNSEVLRMDSSQDASFFGNVGIGTTSPSQQLEITGDFEIPNTTHTNESGIIYKNGTQFIHNFNYGDNGTVTTVGQNTFFGKNAGNFTMGSTATVPYHSSSNTGIGRSTLNSNTIGYANSTVGYATLASNTAGYNNSAIGSYALYSNTTGNNNLALGPNAGRYITNGSTPNTTGDFNIFLGASTKAFADNDQNEIVIGYNATGIGSNSVVLGNDSIVTTALRGNIGIGTSSFGTNAATVLGIANGTAPTTSPTDMVQMWSADQVAGNACLHTRTEGGAVIKLYQQALIADAPGDTAANNAVTINAILDLLENNGLMASS